MRMGQVIKVLEETKRRFDYITAIETGTIRSKWEKHFSTLHIGESLGDNGKLFSVDNTPNSIQVSKEVCKDLTNVEWVLSDSLEAIPKIGEKNNFQFAFLDSVNDGDHIFKELILVLPFLEDGGYVVIDDSGINDDGKSIDMREPRQLKGITTWEFLVKNDIPFSVARYDSRGTNLIIEVNEEMKNKFLNI